MTSSSARLLFCGLLVLELLGCADSGSGSGPSSAGTGAGTDMGEGPAGGKGTAPGGGTGPTAVPPGTADAGTAPATGSSSGTGAASGVAIGSGGPAARGSGGSTGSTASGSGGETDSTGAGGSASAGTGGASAGGGAGSQNENQAGKLTAGSWDDNLNFGWYLSYLSRDDVKAIPGLPLIPRDTRLQITVRDAAGTAVPGASVTIADATGPLLTAPARGDGVLFFFPGLLGVQTGDPLQITASFGGDTATATAQVGDDKVSLTLTAAIAAPVATLELALVVDTTGSMADELAYLNVEMSNIAAQISADFPAVVQRWALVLYRDTGDEYVVRTFDFTDSLTTFQQHIAAQDAAGGGDLPESPEKGLMAGNALSWRDQPGSGARVMFWVADAPHHVGQQAQMVSAFADAQKLGIRIYPIAASGGDRLLEYTMRTAAELTGGRYLFLTDDSGIGVAQGHEIPTVPPCYYITPLNAAMVRMVRIELTGTDLLPTGTEILRTAGSPGANGTCVLDSGQSVQAL